MERTGTSLGRYRKGRALDSDEVHLSRLIPIFPVETLPVKREPCDGSGHW